MNFLIAGKNNLHKMLDTPFAFGPQLSNQSEIESFRQQAVSICGNKIPYKKSGTFHSCAAPPLIPNSF